MSAILDRLTALLERPRNPHHEMHRRATGHKILAVISMIALGFQTSLVLISLFESPLPYKIVDPGNDPLDSAEFVRVLSAVTGGWSSEGNRVDVLTNGDQFYAAELAAIQGAHCPIWERMQERLGWLIENEQ